MAHFLRDQKVENITITEELVTQVSNILETKIELMNKENDAAKKMLISYIIRFDNKGYRVFTLEDLLHHFHQGSKIDRIIFSLESSESITSSRAIGAFIELRLDSIEPNSSNLTVTSDENDWVDASFSSIHDVLINFKNRSYIFRSNWMHFSIQIVGVIFGFLLSLWAAVKISPNINIENSLIISFLFVILIFSNSWTYISQKINDLVHTTFPSLQFIRPNKDKTHWLMQTIIGGIIVAFTLYLLGSGFSYIGEVIGGLINTDLSK
ncbi:MAG: hypothetical protein ISEC1_P0501 [Thiomicrorhabdus sp.]|nr:MAG: hypothetical protein ISEC1_P0501 [Thiomicrorhabdus sp.]